MGHFRQENLSVLSLLYLFQNKEIFEGKSLGNNEIVFVGSLKGYKGVWILLEAFANVAKVNAEVKLKLIALDLSTEGPDSDLQLLAILTI